jgi:hypothetical protein
MSQTNQLITLPFEAEKSLLGKYTKSSTTYDALGRAIAEKFQMQHCIKKVLFTEATKQVKEGQLDYVFNYHRTTKCLYTRLSNSVGVNKSVKYDSTFYTGLVICGYVWGCATCAAKIQERRRVEVAQAFDWAYENGKKVIMTTFTIPHIKADKLDDLLSTLQKAFSILRKPRSYSLFYNRIGFEGLIRSLEVTHGFNGWHPHTHEAWFVNPDVDVEKAKDYLVGRWLKACEKAGLNIRKIEHFLRNSVHITDNCSTSDYLNKQDDSRNWGVDRELVKGSSKTRTKKTVHPFVLAVEAKEGNRRSAELFLEYFHGMKGKAQLYWSPNLKKKVGIVDKTDLEIANEKNEEAVLLHKLSSEDWAMVLKSSKQARAEILIVARNEGAEGVIRYCNELRKEFEEPPDCFDYFNGQNCPRENNRRRR